MRCGCCARGVLEGQLPPRQVVGKEVDKVLQDFVVAWRTGYSGYEDWRKKSILVRYAEVVAVDRERLEGRVGQVGVCDCFAKSERKQHEAAEEIHGDAIANMPDLKRV